MLDYCSVCQASTHPSCPYDASTMLGELYAFDVTHVQCTAKSMSSASSSSVTRNFMFTPIPSSGFSFSSRDFFDFPPTCRRKARENAWCPLRFHNMQGRVKEEPNKMFHDYQCDGRKMTSSLLNPD